MTFTDQDGRLPLVRELNSEKHTHMHIDLLIQEVIFAKLCFYFGDPY